MMRVSPLSLPPPALLPAQLAGPLSLTRPSPHPGRAEAVLGISADECGAVVSSSGRAGSCEWNEAKAVGGHRQRCDGWQVEQDSPRDRMATPQLPGPQKGAAGRPARIIESREPLEGRSPFI